MESKRKFYKDLWNEHANADNMFLQTGRSNYSELDFFILMKGINETLQVERTDILLDIGGAIGYTSAYFSPFVKEIVMFDYAEEMVKKAEEFTSYFDNITVFQDDILEMKKIPKQPYDKVIIGSVLQYLENLEQVKLSMYNIFKLMNNNGKAIFTENPNLRKKEEHILSYNRLNWPKERIEKSLELENMRLWLDISDLKDLAKEIGFSGCYEKPLPKKFWQSTHMFNFVLEK